MGTDIHTRVEYRESDTGFWKMLYMYTPNKWHPEKLELVEPYNGRNYELFAALAGVRGWAEPIVAPRGIPQDVSNDVSDEYDREKDWVHTPSWLTLAELRVAAKDKKTYDKHVRNALKVLIGNVDFMFSAAWRWPDDVDVRIVFWFDS